MYTDDFPIYVSWNLSSHVKNRFDDSQLPILVDLVDTEAQYKSYSLHDEKSTIIICYSNVPTTHS